MVSYRPKPKGKLESKEVKNHRNCTAPGCLPVSDNGTFISMAIWGEGAQNSKPELRGEEYKWRPLM